MDLNKLVNAFFTVDNPIFYALLLTITIVIVIYLINKYVRVPENQQHKVELNEASLRNIRVMAMFAELDPDPLIRIDTKGNIIKTNDAANELIGNLNSKNINDILPGINFSVEDYIKKDKSRIFTHKIGDRIFSISFRGISYLNIGQLYFNDLTERINFEEKLKKSQNQIKQLMSRQQQLIEEERQRLAQELHDGIGQNLVVLKVGASNALENAKGDFETSYFKKQITALENTITELKAILYNLKPKVLEEFGLEAAIRSMSYNIINEFKIKGNVNFVGLQNHRDKTLELNIYRIIQEALNNIVKHSGASEFDISLVSENGIVRILISDDGKGFKFEEDLSYSNGFGLSGIKERVEKFSGSFNIESSPDSGTLLIIELPYRGTQSET